MKRLMCFFFSVFLLIGLCSCKTNVDDFDAPAVFYYIKDPVSYYAEDSVLSAEIRETASYRGNTLDIINYYLGGPASDGLISPFPSGSKALSLDRQDSTVIITVNDTFASLSGIDLSIACAAITMTIKDLTGCDAVEICTEGSLLDGEKSITLSADILYTFDNAQDMKD